MAYKVILGKPGRARRELERNRKVRENLQERYSRSCSREEKERTRRLNTGPKTRLSFGQWIFFPRIA